MFCTAHDVDRLARSQVLRLRATALVILRDRAEADDVVQETLARLWARRDEVRVAEAEAWMRTVAQNIALDRIRKTSRLSWSEPDPDLPDPLGSDWMAGTGDRLDVLQLIAKLPAQYGRVLALRYLADLSEKQTQLVLGITAATLKYRTRHGLRQLRELMNEYGYER
jgi:RNA polymerase sigma-70 factor (ECF subfamily)